MNQVLPISQVRQMTVSGSSNPEHDMNALIGLKAVKDKDGRNDSSNGI